MGILNTNFSKIMKGGGIIFATLLTTISIANANDISQTYENQSRLEISYKVNGQVADQFVVSASGIRAPVATIHACSARRNICSAATYRTNEGRINSTQSESIQGSYLGVDSTGLFWSMSEKFNPSALNSAISKIKESLTEPEKEIASYFFILEENGVIVDTKVVVPDSLIKSIFINKSKYPQGSGEINLPPEPGEYEVIVFFDGQPPSRDSNTITWMVLEGYIVIYADYWRASSSKSKYCLKESQLDEYFFMIKKARDLIEGIPGYKMRGKKVHLLGGSRGGEAALWMSNIAPEMVASLTLISTPAQVYPTCNPEDAPWMFKYKPLPFNPMEEDIFNHASKIIESRQEKSQKKLLEIYFELLKKKTGALHIIPLYCALPTLLQYARNDLMISADELPHRYKKECENSKNFISFEYTADHGFFITPWAPAPCAQEHKSAPDTCTQQLKSQNDATRRFIEFIRNKSPEDIDPEQEKIGECRRSYPLLSTGINECNK